MDKIKAIVYLPIKPEIAKKLNLPVKLPVLAEDLLLVTDQNNIPIDVIVRGLEEQFNVEKDEYWKSYLVYFYYEKFKILLNAKQYDDAQELLNKVKSIAVDYRYNFYSALLQAKLGNYDLAEIEFKQSLALNPNFSLAYYELGNLLFAKKDYDEAVDAYTKAYQIDPNFLLPLLKIGDTYMELGQLDDAEIVYNSIIQKLESQPLASEGLEFQPMPEAYLRLGVLYNIRNQYEKAEKTFRKGLQSAKMPEITYNLAYTLTKLGKHFEAYKMLYELSKEYETPEVLNELGILQRRLGLYEEAYTTFEKIQEDFPENFERIQFYVGKKRFDDEYENEMKKSESKLEQVEFPFQKELEIIIESTDDEGQIITEKFIELTKITPKLQDAQSASTQHFPYILAGIYIAGTEPIIMEKNATHITLTTMGAGLPLACSTAILRLHQYILSGETNIDHFIEDIRAEIEELHFDFANELTSLLEQPLDDFFDKDCTDYEKFTINLIKAIAYMPTKEELKNIIDETLRKTVEFYMQMLE
ncbi:MAG: tetratricopeptide repeat protein [Fervidobacterium sp.]|uniref:Tetratricopeptide repeat-containing protein n=1 Tax=Fervidobacterium gondwanense DSM 13020 TaxID=1121883 RepID=A0A1M7TEU2_FERGO|nr:tetratricopeptide repeat protein [Fervidobacterium gondwanense]SHN69235.1 Tetratricopeptide repeat-containing protein [Fervidobacterium gondwanense DSM 13020]